MPKSGPLTVVYSRCEATLPVGMFDNKMPIIQRVKVRKRKKNNRHIVIHIIVSFLLLLYNY